MMKKGFVVGIVAVIAIGAVVGILAGVGVFNKSDSTENQSENETKPNEKPISTESPSNSNKVKTTTVPITDNPVPTTTNPYTQSPTTLAPTTNTPGNNQEACEGYRNRYWRDNDCHVCPEPKKYLAVFWQTEKKGCMEFAKDSDVIKHVTHIYWSFAVVDPQTGAVDQEFQAEDKEVLECVKELRKHCIKQLASIGGARNRKAFPHLNTDEKISKFGQTTADLIKKFNFDGVDIDDESGNIDTTDKDWYKQSHNVIKYLKSAREGMDKLQRKEQEPRHSLTWDEFAGSYSKERCKKNLKYVRCYNKAISDVVDWINIMAYNSKNPFYEIFLNDILPNQWELLVPKEKIVIGTCSGKYGDPGACAWGDSPSANHQKRLGVLGSSKYLGVMLWTGTTDFKLYNLKNIKLIGQAGKLGIFS